MIKLENVSYTYAPKTPFEGKALHNISLEINDGEFIGIMGKTGCGKSTLLQLIDGLDAPTEGRIFLDDKNINDKHYSKSELREKIGMVFQYPEHQLFEATVEKDVAFGLKHFCISNEQKKAQIKWAIETVGFNFDKVRELSPLSFSGGEKRRLAIAGVIACRPKVLMLDEPVAGLDPTGRKEFLRLIKHLNDTGTTIIIVSHNADVLCEYAKRIIVMDSGRIVRDDSAKKIFSDYDFLKKYKLCTSQVSEIVRMIGDKGIDIPKSITKYDDLLAFLIKEWGHSV